MKRTKGKPPIPMFKGPKKTYYLEKLNWILDFANLDIGSLPPGGFFKILYEFLEFFHGHEPGRWLFRELCQDTERNRKALREVQTRIKAFLTNWLDPKLMLPRWVLATPVRAKYQVFFEENRISLRPSRRLDISREENFEIDEEWVTRGVTRPDFDFSEGLMFSRFFIEDIESSILIVLVPLLEKFPLSYIGICPDCEKFFRIKRKKKSPLCPACLKRRRSRELYYSKKKGGK